jgi:hypothetical protein
MNRVLASHCPLQGRGFLKNETKINRLALQVLSFGEDYSRLLVFFKVFMKVSPFR